MFRAQMRDTENVTDKKQPNRDLFPSPPQILKKFCVRESLSGQSFKISNCSCIFLPQDDEVNDSSQL